MDGILIVYKEAGFTSHDVVAKLRGICGQKKIGHTGTLDPAAEGVLPICLGNATKVCDLLTDRDKEYVATLRFGVRTDTQDMTGTVLEEKPVTCTEEEMQAAVRGFLGPYDQVPPMYSALKVNGKKLCDLARAGKEVERKARPVEIKEIEVLESNLPHSAKIRVVCSKGTYIRTLIDDIGQCLGCGAAMEYLLRTRVGEFSLEEALPLNKLQHAKDAGTLLEVLRPTDRVFKAYPAFQVTAEGGRFLQNGNLLKREMVRKMPQQAAGANAPEASAPSSGLGNAEEMACHSDLTDGAFLRLYDTKGAFAALYTYEQGTDSLKPVKMFFTCN